MMIIGLLRIIFDWEDCGDNYYLHYRDDDGNNENDSGDNEDKNDLQIYREEQNRVINLT